MILSFILSVHIIDFKNHWRLIGYWPYFPILVIGIGKIHYRSTSIKQLVFVSLGNITKVIS